MADKIATTSWTYADKESWIKPLPKSQSPINIVTREAEPMIGDGRIVLNYGHQVTSVTDSDNHLEGTLKGLASINGRPFFLSQFHFHASAEHTIDGVFYPLELHLVHESQVGMLAVIAVTFEFGEENETLNELLDFVNHSNEDNHINILNLIPETLDYYHYLGSLTTPPLTENVEWYVLIEKMTLSEDQWQRITSFHDHNFRDPQDLNNRKVLKKIF